MADFLDGFLGAEAGEPADVTPQPVETPVEPQVEAQPEPAAEPAPEPAPEPTPEPEAPKEEPRTVPLATFLDQRDELRELKRMKDQWESQQRQPQARIDPFDDPEGAAFQQQQMLDQSLMKQKTDISYAIAVRDHGQEQTEGARQWAVNKASSDLAFRAQLEQAMSVEALPLDWIVQQHKRDALLSDIGGNVDDWFTREAAKRGYAAISAPVEAAPVAAVVQPATKPAPPPRSIASERTDASRVTPQGERDGFLASIIGK